MATRLKVRDFGTSLNIAASTQNVDLGSTDFIGAGARSFVTWMNPRSLGGGSGGRLIETGSFRVQLTATNAIGVQATSFKAFDTDAYRFNRWIHLAVTVNANGVTNVFINGVRNTTIDQSIGTLSGASSNIFLGNNAAQSRGFNGKIDGVRIFNRVLTAAEVADLYYKGEPPSDAKTSLLAEYKFDEGAGTVANDTSGNGRTGTITGATYSGDVVVRRRFKNQPATKCIDFSAATDKVDTGTDWIGTGDVTVSAWINPRSIGATNGRVIDNGKFTLRLTATTKIGLLSDGATVASSATGSLPYDNVWRHVVVTRNASGVTNFYINAQKNGTADQSSGTPAAGTTNVTIGNSSNQTRNFDGKIQNLRVHNKVLSQAEIDELYYNGESPANSLIRNFSFDNTLVDSVIGATGVATGTTFSSDVRFKARTATSSRLKVRDFGTSLLFDGVDDYVEVSDARLPASIFTGGFTLSAWIRPRSIGETNGRIFDKSAGSTGENGFYYRMAASGNRIETKVGTGAVANPVQSAANSIIPNSGKFYHVVTTLDSTGLTTHYVNGVVSGTPDSTNVPSAITTTNVVRIGNRSQATDRSFEGLIDSPRIWSRVLTAAEILDLYQNGNVPRTNLAAEYMFNEGSGTAALDSSGNGRDGTISGATYSTNVPIIPRSSV